MIRIEDINDDRLEPFLSLKDKSLRTNNQIVAESPKVVTKLLQTKINISKMLITEDFFNENSELIHKRSIEPYVAPINLFKEIVGYPAHHGVMALADRPEYVDLNQLDDKVIVLNGLTSPENVGSIVRSAAAFKINSMIIDAKTVSPYARRCIRVSMGNIFSIKIHIAENLTDIFSNMSELGYKIVSTANEPGSVAISDFNFNQKMALVIGSEGHGIDGEVKEKSDAIIKIPVDDHVAHLNAATSCCVFLYEMSKDLFKSIK